MSKWAEDPQLYLYAKGDDVYLWRCNKTKNLMPMKIEDFDNLGKVTNHLDLVGLGNTSIINWDRDNYINLVKYISSMRLLVNSHGLVIAELNNYTVDGKIDDNQSPVYIRELDVLPLERFNLRERPIPPIMVQLGGDGTRDAPVVEVTNVQLEYFSHVEKRVTDLEGNVMKLTADLTVQTNGWETLQQELMNLMNRTNEVLDTKITESQAKAETGLVLNWMNDFTDNNWVGIEGVTDRTYLPYVVTVIGPQGTYTVDENTSNVRASYFCRVNLSGHPYSHMAVAIEDLNLGKEKARFSKYGWWLIKYNGITCGQQELE